MDNELNAHLSLTSSSIRITLDFRISKLLPFYKKFYKSSTRRTKYGIPRIFDYNVVTLHAVE